MKFYIYTGGENNKLYDLLLADLEKMENVSMFSSLPAIPDNLKKIWSFHHKPSLNKRHMLPFRKMWNKYSELGKINENYEELCIVFNNVSIGYFEPCQIRNLQKKGVKVVLYLLDTCASYYSKQARIAMKYIHFDKIYTFYQNDAKEYGFVYFDCYFSKQKGITETGDIENDVFFVGSDKGRAAEIEKLYLKLKEEGYKTDFDICFVPDEHTKIEGIEYNHPMEYKDMLSRMMSASCIVDFTGAQSEGISLRAFEAVVYGKKLLTNNKNVENFRFYNKNNMKIFSDINSTDFTFLNNKTEDYLYNNEFSPVNWIKKMEKELWK